MGGSPGVLLFVVGLTRPLLSGPLPCLPASTPASGANADGLGSGVDNAADGEASIVDVDDAGGGAPRISVVALLSPVDGALVVVMAKASGSIFGLAFLLKPTAAPMLMAQAANAITTSTPRPFWGFGIA